MSQQEDDLRALAKIMDFLRAVSIILVVMNVYWFCYEAIRLWGVNIGVVDKILLNFDRTAGLFHSVHETVCRPAACPVLSGYERGQGRENHLGKNMDGTRRRIRAVFPQLVDTGSAAAG